MSGDNYFIGVLITGVLAFIGIYIYAINEWGFLLGIAFGWIPAAIGAFIFGFMWPIIALLIAGVISLLILSFLLNA